MTPTPAEVLDLGLAEDDIDQIGAPDTVKTVRDLLAALLVELWSDPGDFTGKRPWGNSGWDGPVAIALIRAGWIEGSLDEDGYLDDVDGNAMDDLMFAAIKHLGQTRPA